MTQKTKSRRILATIEADDLPVESPTEPAAHERCPICWNRFKGVGRETARHRNPNAERDKPEQAVKVYLKCGECSHDWTAIVPARDGEELPELPGRNGMPVDLRPDGREFL